MCWPFNLLFRKPPQLRAIPKAVEELRSAPAGVAPKPLGSVTNNNSNLDNTLDELERVLKFQPAPVIKLPTLPTGKEVPFKLPPRPEPPKTRIEDWEIPDDKLEEFCRLYDDMNLNEKAIAPTVRFWKFVVNIMPAHLRDCAMKVQFDCHIPYMEVTIENEPA